MEYKSIVCPIDGSELTDKVIETAEYLSRLSGAGIILLNVVEKWYRAADMATDSPEWQNIHEEWLGQGRRLLDNAATKLKGMGVKHIETILADGDAAYEIVAAANKKNADLIIMATHRYSPVGKLFMGSVTSRVSKKSPCPILWLFE
ncbi:MAG: universal stress protein [Deltaproteobacteria bacterium]|nr:universal stress protein [Deltaproteobacteria bacterium]